MRNIAIYLFPGILLAIEWVFRKATGLNSFAFMGPTLATAGLGLTVSLIRPSQNVGAEISEEIKRRIEAKGYKLVFKKDDDAIGAIFLLMAIMLAGWIFTLYLSSQAPAGMWWRIPDFIAIGLLTYLIGIVFAIWKEGI